jgi:hypothetical protein
MEPIREQGDTVLVDVLVQPRASRARIGPRHGDRIKVAVTAPPVDNAANAAVIELFARALRCARGQVEIDSGHGSRRKRVRIRGVTRAAVEEVIS